MEELFYDPFLQQTIRNRLKDKTVITIAHRLDTIIDYDRVFVLDQGSIIEMNKPSVLLNNPQSSFYKMAQDFGNFN